MNDEIILIGNGPSALDHKFGKTIDSYETVVRFSWFHLKGYEEYIGTKTDIWFTTVADPARIESAGYGVGYREVYEHSWEWDARKDKNYKNLKKHFPDLKKTKRETIVEMQKLVGDDKYFCYSTGAIAAYLFSKERGQVTLYGFDWWEKRDKHHYGDGQSIGRIHKPNQELKLFSKLAEQYKIKDLNPKSKIK